MRVPQTISRNVVEAYRCSSQTILLAREENRGVRAENETWDEYLVPELRRLALNILVDNWLENPIINELPNTVDRDTLLEQLPTDLPFELIVEKIPHEYYWSRAAKARWEYGNPADHGNSWRRLYCERYFSEFIEKMENEESDKSECERLIMLVQPYIEILKIRSLIPSKYPFEWSTTQDSSQDQCTLETFNAVHHVPMKYILPRLPELRELQLHFGMIYMSDGFEWRDFEFSVEDCVSLGRGVKDSPRMERIAITRSNLDQARTAALLQGVVVNNNIKVLDLSHCKLSDSGAHAIGEFLRLHKCLKELHLANNEIGPRGVAGIVHGLLQDSSTPLKHLDLRLNPLRDEGGSHICALLLRNSSLEKLNVSGCCFKTDTGIALAEVISSGYMKISCLNFNISNNDLGPIVGQVFDVAMKSSTNIIDFDVRMCNFTKDSEYSISQSIARNKEDMGKKKLLRSESTTGGRRSSLFIPPRAKSLLPPAGFEDLQRPINRGTHEPRPYPDNQTAVHFEDNHSSYSEEKSVSSQQSIDESHLQQPETEEK